jgi:PAS domain S-box-containing protein
MPAEHAPSASQARFPGFPTDKALALPENPGLWLPLRALLEDILRDLEACHAEPVRAALLLGRPNGRILTISGAGSGSESRSVEHDLDPMLLESSLTGAAQTDAVRLLAFPDVPDAALHPALQAPPDKEPEAPRRDWRALWALPLRRAGLAPFGLLVAYLSEARAADARAEATLRAAARQVALVLESRLGDSDRAGVERRHRQVIDSAIGFAIIATDAQGTISSWSRGAQAVFGWTEQEMRGQKLHRIYTPEDIAAGRPELEMAQAMRDGSAADDRWHLRKNGERFWVSGEVTPLRNENGAVIGYVKALRDRTAQRQSELQLRRHNRALEGEVMQRTRERDRIWRNSPDLLAVMRGDGLLLALNPAWQGLLGHDPASLVGTLLFDQVHPEDVAQTRALLARAAALPAQRFENRCRSAAGDWRDFAWSIAVEDGLVYASGRDVTAERRLAEQALQANAMRLRLALDAGAMAAWQWNIRSSNADWMHGMDALHGLAPQQTRRARTLKGYLALVHREDRQRLRRAMGQALASVSDFQAEYRIVRADRQVRWVEARARILCDENGEPSQFSGVCMDITHRKRTESDLRFLACASAEFASVDDESAMLERLTRLAVPDFADWCAVDLLRADGSLERIAIAHLEPEKARAAWELHRRYPPDPNMPHGIWNILRTGKAEIIPNMSDNLLEHAINDPVRLTVLRKLGFRSYLGVPLATQEGVFGVLNFITAESGRVYGEGDLELAMDLARRAATALENARLYREMQHSDRAKDVFLATLAHELRNPLAAVANALALMELRPQDAALARQSAQVIGRQVAQFTRLVDDLMDLSRINTGKIELKREAADLVQILKAALETSRPHIEAAQHALTVELGDGAAPLSADPVRLAQVFSNLLNNAAKYTNAGGSIELRLTRLPQHYRVSVRDNGVGISAPMLKTIFTIFTQVTHPVERSQGGLGIGLALVDGLVKMHGGRVEAMSAGVGCGSEFIVHLPRSAAAAAAAAEAGSGHAAPAAPPLQSPQPRTAPLRILVVDDNRDAADTVAELLRLLGNEVRIANDGKAALEAFSAFAPDVALLDIGLPDIDGYELARRIRCAADDGRGVRLIALTGWGQAEDRERAAAAGFDQHWVKPVDLQKLQGLAASGSWDHEP